MIKINKYKISFFKNFLTFLFYIIVIIFSFSTISENSMILMENNVSGIYHEIITIYSQNIVNICDSNLNKINALCKICNGKV